MSPESAFLKVIHGKSTCPFGRRLLFLLGARVVVGRPVIANPDLARRWQEDHPLNEIDQATVYTDYPMLEPAS